MRLAANFSLIVPKSSNLRNRTFVCMNLFLVSMQRTHGRSCFYQRQASLTYNLTPIPLEECISDQSLCKARLTHCTSPAPYLMAFNSAATSWKFSDTAKPAEAVSYGVSIESSPVLFQSRTSYSLFQSFR